MMWLRRISGGLIVGVLRPDNVQGHIRACTHVDFIVLSHRQTRLPTLWRDIPLSHNILTLNQPVLAKEAKSINLSHWYDSTRVRIPRSTKMGDRRSAHSAIPSDGISGLGAGVHVEQSYEDPMSAHSQFKIFYFNILIFKTRPDAVPESVEYLVSHAT